MTSNKEALVLDHNSKIKSIETCDIDGEGKTFKYILIRLLPKEKCLEGYEEKVLVRGYERCYYHGDIFEEVELKLKNAFRMDCLGGGRIKHEHKKLHIYGYSQGYGKGDHELVKALLGKSYPDYRITCSDEGY